MSSVCGCLGYGVQAVEQLGAENLVVEMGGTLGYSHETWLGNRLVSGSLSSEDLA